MQKIPTIVEPRRQFVRRSGLSMTVLVFRQSITAGNTASRQLLVFACPILYIWYVRHAAIRNTGYGERDDAAVARQWWARKGAARRGTGTWSRDGCRRPVRESSRDASRTPLAHHRHDRRGGAPAARYWRGARLHRPRNRGYRDGGAQTTRRRGIRRCPDSRGDATDDGPPAHPRVRCRGGRRSD